MCVTQKLVRVHCFCGHLPTPLNLCTGIPIVLLILIDNKSTLFQIQNEVKYTPLPEITSGFVYPVPKSEREKAFQVKRQIPIQPIHIFENNHPTPKAFAYWSYYMGKKTFARQKSLLVPDDQVGLFSNLKCYGSLTTPSTLHP